MDERNLALLVIFHYVAGAIIALFSSIFIIHIVMGAVLLTSPESMSQGHGPHPPPLMGAVFVGIGTVAVLSGWALGACMVFAGRCITKRVHHTFCVVAGVACLWMPFGTVLGVFTLILLTKPHIRALFINDSPKLGEKEV